MKSEGGSRWRLDTAMIDDLELKMSEVKGSTSTEASHKIQSGEQPIWGEIWETDVTFDGGILAV